MEEEEDNMQVDQMITLANGENYGLLLESKLDDNKYFLAVLLKDNEEPTDTFKVFKEIHDNGDVLVVEEKDPVILGDLLEDYYEQADYLD